MEMEDKMFYSFFSTPNQIKIGLVVVYLDLKNFFGFEEKFCSLGFRQRM